MRLPHPGHQIVVLVVMFGTLNMVGAGGAEPAKEESSTILPGEGVKNCKVGGKVEDAQALFGKPSKEGNGYTHFADRGVEVSTTDGKIAAMFFYYRSPNNKAFAGKS